VNEPEFIVVGSGASAVHAAWPLVHAGRRVLMLDVGHRDERYGAMVPAESFSTIRRTDEGQHRYFLGERFEGVPFGSVKVGAQLTPPRSFITRDVDRLTPSRAERFLGLESLALGGLAAGWGAGLARFDNADLKRSPVKGKDLEHHYAAVEGRIGVAAEDDDLSPVLGRHEGAMPALRLDTASGLVLERYRQRAEAFNRQGLRMGVSRLAACSREFRGRGPHPLTDMDFWADHARAVYRPRWTVEELSSFDNFEYARGWLVTRFDEGRDGVVVHAVREGEQGEFRGRVLVLAAGVFGTARIVLRSLGLYRRPVPFACNPSTYMPCLNLGMVGREAEGARHSLSQLSAVLETPGLPSLFASIYSYRSLLTFKLMKETPLGVRESLRVMRALIPLLTIVSLQHADAPTAAKTIALEQGEGGGPDVLRIEYALSEGERRQIREQEQRMKAMMRRLGCWALKSVDPGPGASVHYAGTFPMAEKPGELQTSADGLLHGTRAVHIADGSLLPELPCKALTLTLMANADRIGTLLAKR
jgi:choline dehydrogenase-like flavoprotein